MLALLVWKGMKAVGGLGQKGWWMVRRRPSRPRELEAAERTAQAPKEI
jgi:hypothetical protein